MANQFDENSLKDFFTQFLDNYRAQTENCPISDRQKLNLLKSFPVKVDLLIDNNKSYAIVIFSKGQYNNFEIEKLQDPVMVIATANYKKYLYGEQGNFLYLFQVHANQFSSWNVDNLVKDFINYELAKYK